MTDEQSNYDLQGSIGYQITLLSRINERQFEAGLMTSGLTRINWCVLLAISQESLTNPSDIADFVGIDRTATSRALRRLEADGLVIRKAGERDRRNRVIRATKQGEARLVQANAAASANAERFTSKLSRYERDTLSTLIAKLMAGENRAVKGL